MKLRCAKLSYPTKSAAATLQRGGQLACLIAVLCAGAPMAYAATEIGQTSLVVKTVTGQFEDKKRVLVLADTVYMDELVKTELESASEFTFLDGSKMSIGPNTALTLDRFVYDPDSGSGIFEMTLAKGVFRFVTGKLSNGTNIRYKVKTPAATIGIRGTVFEAVVDDKGRLATVLESNSLLDVVTPTGRGVTLRSPGTSTVANPDGSISQPGPAPGWALAAIEQMDTILRYDASTTIADVRGREPAKVAAIEPPAAIQPPAAVEPPTPPEPPAPLDEKGIENALGNAATPAVEGGLGAAVNTADVSARGKSSHGRNKGGDAGAASADAGGTADTGSTDASTSDAGPSVGGNGVGRGGGNGGGRGGGNGVGRGGGNAGGNGGGNGGGAGGNGGGPGGGAQ